MLPWEVQHVGSWLPLSPSARLLSRSGAGVLLEQEVGSPLYHSSGLKPPPRVLSSLFLSYHNSSQAVRPEESSPLQEIPFRLLHRCILYQAERKACQGLPGPCCFLPQCLCMCSSLSLKLLLLLYLLLQDLAKCPRNMCSPS